MTEENWYVLNRIEDVGGVSGTGPIAYARETPRGKVLMLWDTGWPATEQLPDMQTVRDIHGHDGKTEVLPLSDESRDGRAMMARARELCDAALPDLCALAADLVSTVDPSGVEPQFRLERTSPHNVYLMRGNSRDLDEHVGVFFQTYNSTLAVAALNHYLRTLASVRIPGRAREVVSAVLRRWLTSIGGRGVLSAERHAELLVYELDAAGYTIVEKSTVEGQ